MVIKVLPWVIALLLAFFIALNGIPRQYPFYTAIEHARGVPVITPAGIYMIPYYDYYQIMEMQRLEMLKKLQEEMMEDQMKEM